jgi:hypothetical protein
MPVFWAGIALVAIGTLTYSLTQDRHVVDALYFAVATLTTTSVADPVLMLESRWLKVFTVLYLLIGIGVRVELLRRLVFAFIAVRRQPRPHNHRSARPS